MFDAAGYWTVKQMLLELQMAIFEFGIHRCTVSFFESWISALLYLMKT
jgi:hypothetical protein